MPHRNHANAPTLQPNLTDNPSWRPAHPLAPADVRWSDVHPRLWPAADSRRVRWHFVFVRLQRLLRRGRGGGEMLRTQRLFVAAEMKAQLAAKEKQPEPEPEPEVDDV
eukprot:COSAG06_NODE_2852_length_6174_cov_65.049053_2_plen_108_part_00